ncbi:hypothetical protein Hanom_Chr12g01117251 [Helianthus anomalus]
MVARTTMSGRLMTTINCGGATSMVKRWFGILGVAMDSCMGGEELWVYKVVFVVMCREKKVVYGG